VTVEPERRQTPSERQHEALMAALNRAPVPPECAVDIARNAKGDVQFDVTVRGHDPDACLTKAIELADQLAAKYPRSNGAA
jgi:hypothetical protein